MRISYLCPTRGRPEAFKRFCTSAQDMTHSEYEIIALIDRDDPCFKDYGMRDGYLVNHEKQTTSERYNAIAKYAKGDVLVMVNDDNIIAQPHWDDQLFEAIPDDGIYCAWPNGQDGQCINPIVSRLWYETAGYFTPPAIDHFYVDTFLHDVARRIDRAIYLPKVMFWPTEHREASSEQMKDAFEQFRATKQQRKELAEKLRKEMA